MEFINEKRDVVFLKNDHIFILTFNKIHNTFCDVMVENEQQYVPLEVAYTGEFTLLKSETELVFPAKKKNKRVTYNGNEHHIKAIGQANYVLTAYHEEDKVHFIYSGENGQRGLYYKKRKQSVYDTFSSQHYHDCHEGIGVITLSLDEINQTFETSARLDLFALTDQERYQRIRTIKIRNIQKRTRYYEPLPLSEELAISLYRTKDHSLSLIINSEHKILAEALDKQVYANKFVLKNYRFCLRLEDHLSKHPIGQLVMIHRLTGETYYIPSHKRKTETDNYVYTWTVDQIDWTHYYYDLYVEYLEEWTKPILVRVRNRSLRQKIRLQHAIFSHRSLMADDQVLMPYVTQNEDLSIVYKEREVYDTDRNRYKELLAYLLSFLLMPFYHKKNIWLFHEKFSDRAQDNAFYLFQHMMEKGERNAYFVIKKESPDYHNLDAYAKHRIDFMSFKHMLYICLATKIVSSESKGHGYIWRQNRGLIAPILIKKYYVFLQHGVLGLKRLDNTFVATGINRANLFIGSSDLEKEIIQRELGYKEKNIAIMGLARWDNLYQEDVLKAIALPVQQRQILMMMTWRAELEGISHEDFMASTYYQEIKQFLTDTTLLSILTQNHYQLKLYLHPKFADYIELFFEIQSSNVLVVTYDQEQMNDILLASDILITDYSSLYWEAIYQRKCCVLYQFDQEEYLETQGAYLDFEQDIYTPIFKTAAQVSHFVNRYIEELSVQTAYDITLEQTRERYYKYLDNQNCERTLAKIKEHDVQKNLKHSFLDYFSKDPLARLVWKKIRNNKFISKLKIESK